MIFRPAQNGLIDCVSTPQSDISSNLSSATGETRQQRKASRATDGVLIVDASGLLHRAAYRAEGSTQASLRVLERLLQALVDAAPQCGFKRAVFDARDSGDERRNLYPEYKAKRRKEHSDPVLCDLKDAATGVFTAMGFTCYRSADGLEADDLIAALAEDTLADGEAMVVIASDDKDLLCLLRHDRVSILRHGGSSLSIVEWRAAHVRRRYGIDPGQMSDYLSLCGDSCDGIPGATGIGDKRALELLAKYSNVAGILRAAKGGELKGAVARAFQEPEFLLRFTTSCELVRLRMPTSKISCAIATRT